MGRKSKAGERREQILSAFERCIVRKGLHRTTLDDVAQEAKLARPLIRHNVGNWEALVQAAAIRLSETYLAAYQSYIARAREKRDLEVLTQFLFSRTYGTITERQDLVLGALSSAAQTDKGLRDVMRQMYRRFEKRLADEILFLHDDVSRVDARNVAYAIICLAEQNSIFQSWGFPAERARGAKRAADAMLVQLLER